MDQRFAHVGSVCDIFRLQYLCSKAIAHGALKRAGMSNDFIVLDCMALQELNWATMGWGYWSYHPTPL